MQLKLNSKDWRVNMSVTQWVITKYTENNEDLNLEPAKNFSFVWSLFEHMSKGFIFQEDSLKFAEFLGWANALQIHSENGRLIITDTRSQKSISGELVDNIHRSFNHFYQKYTKNNQSFIDLIFNQNTPQVTKEKNRFIEFMQECDKSKMQHKISFLYFIAKRMRNKFFHGIKSISQVSEDHKEFEKICEYLIAVISLFEDYH